MTMNADWSMRACLQVPVANPGDAPTRPVAIEETTARDRGILIQMAGPGSGRLHSLTAPVSTLGRGRDCTAYFDDATLSRVHARVWREGKNFIFEDAGSTNGSFVNGRRVGGVELSDGDRVRLGASVVLRFQLVNEEEEQGLVRMFQGAVHDGVTGVYNRRHLEDCLLGDVAYAGRHGTELSIVLFELDYFHQVVGAHGVRASDALLHHVAKLARDHVRTEDMIARFGGEVFAIVARGIALAGAHQLAERMRHVIAKSEMPIGKGSARMTASFGVASLACCKGYRTVDRLLACAQEALTQAKANGCNYVAAG
jgi:two-component system cell cycle response regulator